eukprot:UN27973
MVPTLKKMGRDIPDFAFNVPGVSSLSCDTHKFGFTTKGTSVLLFENSDLRHYCYFTIPEWTGGLYCTPTLPGSRPGSIAASTWAVMVSLGEAGYRKYCTDIIETVDTMLEGLKNIPELVLHGKPISTVIAFRFRPDIKHNYFCSGRGYRSSWLGT